MQATVAILEDQPVFRECLVQLVEAAGFEVRFHGARIPEFLESVWKSPPSVAIVDLRLQGEQSSVSAGLSVVRTLKTNRPEVSTLVLSAADEPHVAQECYREGAAAVLSKQEVDTHSLVGAVRALAEGHRWVAVGLATAPVPAAVGVPAPRAALQSLTPRERQVLSFVAAGADNLKIAACLGVTERTVKAHVTALYRKLGPENRAEMALLARDAGVLPPAGIRTPWHLGAGS